MSEYRVTIGGNRFRVEAGNERIALYGLLRRMTNISPPSQDHPILVEVKCGDTWTLDWHIDRADVLRGALTSAGVAVFHEVWNLDEGRGGLPTPLPLTSWQLLKSEEAQSAKEAPVDGSETPLVW